MLPQDKLMQLQQELFILQNNQIVAKAWYADTLWSFPGSGIGEEGIHSPQGKRSGSPPRLRA